jgi:hypothetical protein
MITDALKQSLETAIFDAIKECMEEPEDGWDAYDGFKYMVYDKVSPVIKDALRSVDQPKAPCITKKKKGTVTGGVIEEPGTTEIVRNPYAKWVSGISKIRKGECDGLDEVDVGCFFKNESSASAIKYLNERENLNLHGCTMTVKDLIAALKDAFPSEKRYDY